MVGLSECLLDAEQFRSDEKATRQFILLTRLTQTFNRFVQMLLSFGIIHAAIFQDLKQMATAKGEIIKGYIE